MATHDVEIPVMLLAAINLLLDSLHQNPTTSPDIRLHLHLHMAAAEAEVDSAVLHNGGPAKSLQHHRHVSFVTGYTPDWRVAWPYNQPLTSPCTLGKNTILPLYHDLFYFSLLIIFRVTFVTLFRSLISGLVICTSGYTHHAAGHWGVSLGVAAMSCQCAAGALCYSKSSPLSSI